MDRCLALLVVLILAGCIDKPVDQLSYTEAKALTQELQQRCAAQGAPSGSPEFDACMKQEVSRETSTRQAAADFDRARVRKPTYCRQFGYTVTCF